MAQQGSGSLYGRGISDQDRIISRGKPAGRIQNLTLGDFARNTMLKVPDYQPDLSGAKLLNHVSNELSHAADVAIDTYQEAAAVEGEEEGRLAGLKSTNPTDIPFRDKGTIKADRFNAVAMQTSLAKGRAEAGVAMKGIANANPADPEAYKMATDAFISERVKPMKEDPNMEVQGYELENSLKLRQQEALLGISNNAMKESALGIRKDIEDTMTILEMQQQDEDGMLFSEDPDLSGSSFIAHSNSLKEIKALAMTVDPLTGRRYYNETEIEYMLEEATKNYVTAQTLSLVNNPDTSIETLVEIMDGDFVHEFKSAGSDGMTIDPRYVLGDERYQKTIASQVGKVLDARNDAWDNQQKEREEVNKINRGLNFNGFVNAQRENSSALTYQQIQAAVKNRDISPEQGTKLINGIGAVTKKYSDPVAMAAFSAKMEAGETEEASAYLAENADKFTAADMIGNESDIASSKDKAAEQVSKDHLKTWRAIAIMPPEFGMSDRAATLEVVEKMTQVYRNNKNVMSEELAYQLLRDQWTQYKTGQEEDDLNDFGARYSRFIVNTSDGGLDAVATEANIDSAYSRKEINENMRDQAKTRVKGMARYLAIANMSEEDQAAVVTIPVPEEEPEFLIFSPSTWLLLFED